MGSLNFLLIKILLPLYFSEHSHHQKSLVKLECRTNTGIAITLVIGSGMELYWDRRVGLRSVRKKEMPEKTIYNVRH